MRFTLTVISLLLLVLYVKELRKNHKMENDYNYINSRLLDIVNHEESNYILVPSDLNILYKKRLKISTFFWKSFMTVSSLPQRSKNNFTNISHDLRTPITVLKGEHRNAVSSKSKNRSISRSAYNN